MPDKRKKLIFFSAAAREQVLLGEEERKIWEEKRKKRKKILLGITASLLLILLGSAWYFVTHTFITQVTVEGSEHYSEAEIKEMLLPEEKDLMTAYAFYKSRFGEKTEIPFVEKYTVRVQDLHSLKITIYEKSLAGCIEYMGTYLYFDGDGVVVESSGEKERRVPVVAGLDFRSLVLYEQLEVEDPSVFREILNISQLLEKYELSVDYVDFKDPDKIEVVRGEIRCILGENKNMAEKIAEFTDMLPMLEGRAGTVHLEDFDPAVKNPSYPFVPKAQLQN